MTHHQLAPPHEALEFEVPWEEELRFRANPQIVTSLLREQVPILDFVQWRVARIEPGVAESLVPLNSPSTNQHFTHQAALFVLAADYTGGIALASVFSGWPVVGVHPVHSSRSASLWLLKVEIKYLRPSVADLTVLAEIDPERRARLKRRFFDGKPVIETVRIRFRNGDVDVAEAELTYFARQSEKLRSDGASPDKVNLLYELKLTSSAELIAGVRARESGVLFQDPYAAKMAGQHGVALATRFCERSPQLGGMVAARTRHLDWSVLDFAAAGGRDLVILGVGWDMRPFRLAFPEGMRIYELDFPTTLAERRRRLVELGLREPSGLRRIEVPIDLRTTPLACVLEQHVDRSEPVFIAWEGMSMYFQEEEVRKILHGMSPLVGHSSSRLWVDLVDRRAVDHPEEFSDDVQAFLRGMQILGEPFTFGVDCPEEFMASNGFQCHQVVPSDVFLNGRKDPVYSLYKFCTAGMGAARPAAPQTPERWSRVDLEGPIAAEPHRIPDQTSLVALPISAQPALQDPGEKKAIAEKAPLTTAVQS